MGKKVIAIFMFFCLLCGNIFAQKDSAKIYPYRGLLRAALTYSIGNMPSISITNAYLTGNLEYYTGSKISVRGDAYYFFNSLNNSQFIKYNEQLYFGACYNFSVGKHFNPFIGIQPGLAYIKLYPINGVFDTATFSPLGSIITGFNFYAEKWFHIMINVRYSISEHLDKVSIFNTNELSFSFGLGWDLDVLQK